MADKKHLITALSTVAAVSFSLSAMAAGENATDLFQAEELPAGFMITSADDTEGSCGEGSCGEGNCGEDDDKDEEGSCGEDDDKDEEGSCGEGSCGEDDDKDEEGSCGEGSCGS